MDTLSDAGYDVLEADGGVPGYELACHESPDVMVLDVNMPDMDGFEVLRKLRENRSTEGLSVIMLTVLSPIRGEQIALSFGVDHYITKPWEPGTVEAAVKVALREAEHTNGSTADDDPFALPSSRNSLRTGTNQIDQKLDGGLPLGSLTLLEGAVAAGKSVLSQHFLYEAHSNNHGVAYLTAETPPTKLITQMGTLGLDVSSYFRDGNLGIYPLEGPAADGGESPDGNSDPRLASLAHRIEALPGHQKIIIVDSITELASQSPENVVITFFSRCKGMSDVGRTIILVARSYAFDEKLLDRLQNVCDAHISLASDKIGEKTVKMLEVRKVRGAKLSSGNMVGFDVEEGEGIRIVPGGRVRV